MEGLGRDLPAISFAASPYRMALNSHYSIYIRGNTLSEATEEALHLSYWLVTRTLQEHQRAGRNGEFEAFAVELLAFLQANRHLYTTTTEQ
jgi:hypothetical protein